MRPEMWGKWVKGVGLWWGLLTPTAHWSRRILLDSAPASAARCLALGRARGIYTVLGKWWAHSR